MMFVAADGNDLVAFTVDELAVRDDPVDPIRVDLGDRTEYNSYADALRRIFGLPVKEKLLYFLYPEKAVKLP